MMSHSVMPFFSGNMILSLLSLRLGEVISEIGSTVVQLPLYNLGRKSLKLVCVGRSVLAEISLNAMFSFRSLHN